MNGVLFETRERAGSLWRLEVVTHNGRTFANWRKWWRDADGALKPTRQGGTFPPEGLLALLAAFGGLARCQCAERASERLLGP